MDNHHFTYYPHRIYRKYRFSFETTPSVKRENHPAVKTSKTEKIKTSRI